MSTSFTPPGKELITAIAAGEEDAFYQLYRLYFPTAYSITFSFLKSREKAEDLVQEVFLSLWKKKDILHDIDNFAAWFATILRNRVISEMRSDAFRERLKRDTLEIQQLFSPASSVTANAELSNLKKLVSSVLATLSERQQLIFKISREENLTHEQIAARLGISKRTVTNTITLVLQKLRQALGSHGYFLFLFFLF